MKKEQYTEQLQESLKIVEWLRQELEKCGTRLKILEEDIINEREDEEEIEFESKLMDEILGRAKFEYRNCKNIQSKIVNS